MPLINTIDKSQQAILDSLMEKPKTIRQIILSTGLSDTTVRQNLKVLTKVREVLLDTERQPYLYSLNVESQTMQYRNKVDTVKRQLLGDGDPENTFVKTASRLKKERLPEAAITMEIIVTAIHELEAEGKLIDTL